MKLIGSLIVSLGLFVGTAALAQNNTDSHRYGGYNSHGKGSSYYGGYSCNGCGGGSN